MDTVEAQTIADKSWWVNSHFANLKPHIFIDGDKWCALYGDNLQDGVAGFGDSPNEAMINFDKMWYEKLPMAQNNDDTTSSLVNAIKDISSVCDSILSRLQTCEENIQEIQRQRAGPTR